MRKKRNYTLILGGALTACMVALILVGFFWTPYAPNAMSAAERMEAPSLAHILGTDNFGRDIFSRILDGAGTTLLISAAVVAIGTVFGVLIGALTGYFGGWLDELLMRFNDIVTAFPSILLALVLISLMGSGVYNVIIALGILFIPSFARITRGEFARQKEMDYVKSAQLMGVSHFRILFVHILPNVMPVLLPAMAIGFNNAVLAEASMSFLGIGVTPPTASLGYMLSEAQTYMFSAPWYVLSTGFAIVLLILGFGLLSDGLGSRSRL